VVEITANNLVEHHIQDFKVIESRNNPMP